MQAHVNATVAPAPDQHRGGRQVAMQDTRPVAMGDRFDDLLKQAEPLVEGEVWLVANERVKRERVLEGFEEHRRSEGGVVYEGAVREDAGVLTDLRERLRFASRSAVQLRAPLGRRRGGHEVAADTCLVALNGSVLREVLLVALAVVEQLAELVATHHAR